MGSVEDKVAIVTGAGRGIGRAVALRLARAGARVVLVSRSRPELDEVAAEITAGGGQAAVVAADVADPAGARRIVDEAHAAFGPVDILVNNAGVAGPVGPIVKVDPDAWVRSQEINLLGPARLTMAVLPGMLDRGWGRILNMSSGAARSGGIGGQNAYATSKAGLETHTLKLALELEGTGVTANVLRPGASDTAMQTWMSEQDPEVVGEAVIGFFAKMRRDGLFKDPDLPAGQALELIEGDENGAIIEMTRTKDGDRIVDTVATLRALG